MAQNRSQKPVHPQQDYAGYLEQHVYPDIQWLDIGCGRQIVPDWAWRPGQEKRVLDRVHLTGLDVDEAIHEHPYLETRLIGLADHIPSPDSSFDLVTANMVMEHVKDPLTVFSEVKRVLKPGGKFIFHTPNKRYYLIRIASITPQAVKNYIVGILEGRHESDVFPTFYRCNTPEQVQEIAAGTGLVVDNAVITGPYPSFGRTRLRVLEQPVLELLKRPGMERYRSNLISVLRKPQ